MLSCYLAAVSTYCLISQPFVLGETRQKNYYNVWVTGLCVAALFCAVGGEHPHLGLVCLLGGASDVVVDELLSRCRPRRGLPVLPCLAIVAVSVPVNVPLVPGMQMFQRDSRSGVLFPVLFFRRLFRDGFVTMVSLILVKILGTEDEVRRTY